MCLRRCCFSWARPFPAALNPSPPKAGPMAMAARWDMIMGDMIMGKRPRDSNCPPACDWVTADERDTSPAVSDAMAVACFSDGGFRLFARDGMGDLGLLYFRS